MSKEVSQGDTCTFKYDLAGRMYQRDYRTAANSPTGTIADSNVFTFAKSSSTLGNGVVETRGYNSDNTLSTISFGGSGTAIGNLTYTWDSNKNKTSETIGGVMSPYSFTQAGTTYDAEDRLTGFARAATSGTPQLSQSWNLSAVGDWNSVTTNGTAQSRTHGPTHELLMASSQSVTHDTKDNMLLIPASVRANSSPLVLTWDFDNRMVSADVGADSVIDVTHQYDALGRRVARTASGSTTVFVQVDQQTICDYASGAAPASSTYRYLYASYIDEPIVRIATSNSETTWYHRNQQYSIVACTDSSGAATERYAYTAYGLPTITDASGTVRTSSAIGIRYTYTGREWDGPLWLYHYRARMYEATVGRFCSRDPIGYEGGDHFYSYARGNVFNRTDPSGESPINPIISHQCGRVLLATIAGWRALGNNCAVDLLAASLRKKPDPCPDSCRDALKRDGFGFVSHCLRSRLAYQGACGKTSRHKFDLSGNHYFKTDPLAVEDPATDLGFGFGHFAWRAEGECRSTCDAAKEGCCCDCSAKCGFEITTGPDDYDFKPDPKNGENFPHPRWCIDYLQKQGEAKIFKVQCRITAYGINAGVFRRCPGPPLPDSHPCPSTVSGAGRPVELE